MILLRIVISTMVILTTPAVQAELLIAEKIRPQPQSLIHPDIARLAPPPTPNNMSLPAFGQSIIGWGTGPDGAEKRLNHLNKRDVDQLKTQQVNLKMIQAWQQFYENETQRNPNNPTAPLRAKLMNKIAQLW